MKKSSFISENKYILFPIFVLIGVYLDYVHLYLSFPTDYIGVYYGLEINLSELIHIVFTKIKSIIGV